MALGTAQSVFDRVSFDLIYALPGQSAEAWRAELARALSFGTGHLSLYQLTIEPGTRFAAMAARGELVPADPDESAALYELTQEMTAAAGLPAYEISNHARPGEESRHNLAYWRYRNYAGIGPGAHGRRGGMATQRHRKPENWLAALARNGHGIAEEKAIPPAEQGVEALLMGLRLAEGVPCRPEQLELAAVERLSAQGLLDYATAIACASRRAACCCSTRSSPRSCGSVEAARRGRDDGGARRADLAHLERPVGEPVAAEAEGAVDAAEAARIAQRPRREGAADRPVRRHPHREQHRVIAERGQPEGPGIVAGAVAGRELPEERVGRRRIPGAAQAGAGADIGLGRPELGRQQPRLRRGLADHRHGLQRDRAARRRSAPRHRRPRRLRPVAAAAAVRRARSSAMPTSCPPAPSTAWVIAWPARSP